MNKENGNPTLQEQGDINSLIDDKISQDAEFQTSLDTMSQEDAEQAISEKKAELLKQEFSSIAEKAKKAEELANNYKIRAEKAEKGVKKEPESAKESEKQGLSTTDFYALTKANVAEEDIPEVENYAKFKGITIAEALKSSVMKSILSEKEEQRKTAETASVKTTRRQVQQPSGLEVYEKAVERGEMPSDPAELAKARTAKLREKKDNQRN